MTHTREIRIRLFDDQVRGSFFVEEQHLRGEVEKFVPAYKMLFTGFSRKNGFDGFSDFFDRVSPAFPFPYLYGKSPICIYHPVPHP